MGQTAPGLYDDEKKDENVAFKSNSYWPSVDFHTCNDGKVELNFEEMDPAAFDTQNAT